MLRRLVNICWICWSWNESGLLIIWGVIEYKTLFPDHNSIVLLWLHHLRLPLLFEDWDFDCKLCMTLDIPTFHIYFINYIVFSHESCNIEIRFTQYFIFLPMFSVLLLKLDSNLFDLELLFISLTLKEARFLFESFINH